MRHYYSPSICGGKVNVFQILNSVRQSCRWSRQTCSSWQLVETGVCHLSRLVPVLSHNVKRLLENQKARAPRPQRTSVSLIQFCKVLIILLFSGRQQLINYVSLVVACDTMTLETFPQPLNINSTYLLTETKDNNVVNSAQYLFIIFFLYCSECKWGNKRNSIKH